MGMSSQWDLDKTEHGGPVLQSLPAGGAGNATGIINYHSNILFGTILITKDHSYYRIW